MVLMIAAGVGVLLLLLWFVGPIVVPMIAPLRPPPPMDVPESLEPLSELDFRRGVWGIYIVNNAKQDVRRLRVTTPSGSYVVRSLRRPTGAAALRNGMPRAGYFDQRRVRMTGQTILLRFEIQYNDGRQFVFERDFGPSDSPFLLQVAILDDGEVVFR